MMNVRSESAYIPASSTKIVTAAVAIKVLGKDFTYTTNVHANIDANGVAQCGSPGDAGRLTPEGAMLRLMGRQARAETLSD